MLGLLTFKLILIDAHSVVGSVLLLAVSCLIFVVCTQGVVESCSRKMAYFLEK